MTAKRDASAVKKGWGQNAKVSDIVSLTHDAALPATVAARFALIVALLALLVASVALTIAVFGPPPP